MKIRTKDLTGAALDWAVAECKKVRTYVRPYEHTMTGLCILDADLVDMETDDAQELRYSRDWAQGGPIIDHMVREGLRLTGYKSLPTDPTSCQAQIGNIVTGGPTPLIAAMRCYVASRLGATVDIPQGLLPAEL